MLRRTAVILTGCLWLLPVGCSNKADVAAPELAVSPAAAECVAPSGYCFAVQFIGFQEYSEEPILFLEGVSGQQGYNQANIEHPELQNAFASVSWSSNSGCTNSFTYMDPYSDLGGVLFPPGSKYEKFSLTWDLLCADIKGCSSDEYFFDIRNLRWGGRELSILDSTGAVIQGQEFSFNEKGHGPATLHVAEVVPFPGGEIVRGVRMELPGKKSVVISVTEQRCP